MKKFLPLFVFFFLFGFLSAQTEISSFNATGGGYSTTYLTDYQCLGVNPANLGWTRNQHSVNLGFFEFAASMYSEPLTKSEIFNDLINNPITLDAAGKLQAAEKFTDTRIFASGNVLWVGFSYQDEEIGGFAFSVRERGIWNSVLNDNAANFLYLGYNDPYFDSIANENGQTVGYSTDPEMASVVYKGTDQHFLLYREYNLGYGRKIIENENVILYGGIGLKYLVGYAMTQYYQDESGKLIGNSALSPVFDVTYDEPTPSQVEGDGYKKVGNGFGIDIGTTVQLYDNLKISLAVNDIGSIKWNGNVYTGNDTRVWSIDTDGLDNYNIFQQGQLIESDNHPDDPNEWVGVNETKIKLPTNLRGGASYRFNDLVEAGLDLYVPLGDKVPGVYESTVFGIGGKLNPAEWVQISLGVVTGGKFGTNVPLGFSFYPVKTNETTWEIGFATRDVITNFKQNDPTVSAAFGFLRFSFGQQSSSTRYLEQ